MCVVLERKYYPNLDQHTIIIYQGTLVQKYFKYYTLYVDIKFCLGWLKNVGIIFKNGQPGGFGGNGKGKDGSH